jgi:hypothetical protein
MGLSPFPTAIVKWPFVVVILVVLLALAMCSARAQAHGHRHVLQNAPQISKSYAAHDSRPARWCGWWMRHEVDRDPGPQFNLARAWAGYGAAASGPGPGIIGVMPHHVFKVVSVLGRGLVMAISGNDGHAVRTRPRSTAGVIAWRQG